MHSHVEYRDEATGAVNGGRISGQRGGASVGHDAPWP
jgi:hypothetical protein